MSHQPSSDSVLQPGQILDGKYEILAKIGQGGMGVVYKARATALDRNVAIKMVNHADADTLRRFRREAQSLAQINHPAVVRIDDFGDAGPAGPYLVLAYVAGKDLDLLAESTLSIPDAVDLALAMASGISACHRRGIIHRDLKPSNIRVTTEASWQSRVKILGFGLALPFDSPILQARQTRITSMGSVPATPRYIAPELLRHREPTAQCDQYGVASLLYLLLTQRAPFETFEGDQLVRAILEGGIVKPSLFRPDLPTQLGDAIIRGLHNDPGQRFDSVDDFASALLPFANPSLQNVWTHYFAVAKRPIDRRLIEPVSAMPPLATGGTILTPMSDPSPVLPPSVFRPERIPTPPERPAEAVPHRHPTPATTATSPPVPARDQRGHRDEQSRKDSPPATRSTVLIFAAGVILGAVLTIGAFLTFLLYHHRVPSSPAPAAHAAPYPGSHGHE
jgi:serine/threonine protein kinase